MKYPVVIVTLVLFSVSFNQIDLSEQSVRNLSLQSRVNSFGLKGRSLRKNRSKPESFLSLFRSSEPKLDNRMFHISPFRRPRSRCNRRIRVAHGVTRFRDRGSFVRFTCSDGYFLLGPTVAVCLRDRWSEPPPICIKPGCKATSVPMHGMSRPSYGGAVVSFFCEVNYRLEGSQLLYCDGFLWNGTEPTCVSTAPTTESGSSTYEPTDLYDWDLNITNTTIIQEETTGTSSIADSITEQDMDHSSSPANFSVESESTSPTSKKLYPELSSTTNNANPTTTPLYSNTTRTNIPAQPSTTQNHDNDNHEELIMSNEIFYDSEKTFSKSSSKLVTFFEFTPETQTSKVRSHLTSTTVHRLPWVPEATKQTFKVNITSRTKPAETTTEKYITRKTTLMTHTQNSEIAVKHTTSVVQKDEILETIVPTKMPEFVPPVIPIEITPHKLDDTVHHHKMARYTMFGGIVMAVIGSVFLVIGLATYCWRKNIGIARAHSQDIDGRTLSTEANDDFMWMDSTSR